MQTWSCNDCGRRFRNERREKVAQEKSLWKQYVFEKQTLRELKKKEGLDKRTIRDRLDVYQVPAKEHSPRSINLVADALYFGERNEDTSWCAVVFRDPKEKENLWWNFGKTETTSIYSKGRVALEELGYQIRSLTGDGFSGLRAAFFGIPFQMCQVHMERIVTAGTTKHPQLEAGRVLLALIHTLHETDRLTFTVRVRHYMDRYGNFLNERTTSLISGETFFTHEPLRKAALSLVRFLPYLFTFEQDSNIPKTTNSLEGHFSHIRDIVEVHRGLRKSHKEKVLSSIFLASTIAPTDEKLDEIL